MNRIHPTTWRTVKLVNCFPKLNLIWVGQDVVLYNLILSATFLFFLAPLALPNS
jgi:hypothetical protein